MAVVATGFFDGVHLGHRKVIETLVRAAKERSDESLVLTFWPHPRTVLQHEARSLRLLTSLDEKKRILYSLGVDRIEVLPFTMDFSSLTAEQYLRDIVCGRFNGKTVIIGYDNRIGRDNLDSDVIAPLAESLGLEVIRCAPFSDISSTKVRACISSGKVEQAAEMLGVPYSLTGVVVSGNMMGRTIGYPTANLRFYEPLKILPAPGAYFTGVFVDGRQYHGMTNVSADAKVETHILGFDAQIYGMDMRLDFLKYLRDERRFQSVDELRKQLDIDLISCRNILFGI